MDIIRNLYMHKYSLPKTVVKMIEYLYGTWLLCLVALLVYVLHKMFYKTKSTSSRRASGSPTVTTQNDGLRSQQYYIYSIDGRTSGNAPSAHLDLPPKYEDVIKDPNYVRREVS